MRLEWIFWMKNQHYGAWWCFLLIVCFYIGALGQNRPLGLIHSIFLGFFWNWLLKGHQIHRQVNGWNFKFWLTYPFKREAKKRWSEWYAPSTKGQCIAATEELDDGTRTFNYGPHLKTPPSASVRIVSGGAPWPPPLSPSMNQTFHYTLTLLSCAECVYTMGKWQGIGNLMSDG